MKKLSLLFAALVSLSAVASIEEATVLKVSKNINEGNVLHYKVEYDTSRCEFTSEVFAEWKMDEEDGRWKSLNESMGMIRRPLEPTTSVISDNELSLETESMSDFRKKKILSSSQISISIEPAAGECEITTNAVVKGQRILLSEIKSHMNFLRTGVKKVTVIGEDHNGRRIVKDYN